MTDYGEIHFRSLLRPLVEDAAGSLSYAYDGFTVEQALAWFDNAPVEDLQGHLMHALQNGLLDAMELRRSDDESEIIPESRRA